MKTMVRHLVLAVSIFGATAALPAWAENTAPTSASTPEQSTAVSTFKANPSAFMAAFPAGGSDMIDQISKLVQSDPTIADTLAALARTASPDQVAAIGAGIAQAAVADVKSGRVTDARSLQQAIALSGLQALNSAFAAATDPTTTAAIGATGGAIGGPINPEGNGKPNFGPPATPNDHKNTPFTFSLQSAGGSSISVTRTVSAAR